jgi:hypothetical protein
VICWAFTSDETGSVQRKKKELARTEGTVGTAVAERYSITFLCCPKSLDGPRLVMPALVGSDLRADRELGRRTPRTGSPRRCDHRMEAS